jgi:hypothetical protein
MAEAAQHPDDHSQPKDAPLSDYDVHRLERNWSEILQELRVLQTGTQILTGFLLAMAFQSRFQSLSRGQVAIYLVLVAFSVLAAVLALAPVALHRALFRRHAKVFLVRAANLILRLALVVVGITLSGIILLIFDVVAGPVAGTVAGVATALICTIAWLALPLIARRHRPSELDLERAGLMDRDVEPG